MSRVQRVWTGLLLLLAVGVLAGAVYVIGHHDVVPDAGQTPGYSASAPGSVAPVESASLPSSGSASQPSSGPAQTVIPAPIKTVFLGDDYTLGIGASSSAKSWTALVSSSLRLDATVLGDEGGGYARASRDGKTYADFVDEVVAANPELIVVSGGRNDVVDSAQTLNGAARALFAELHARLPDATLVAIAPLWGDSSRPAKLTPVTNAVKIGVADAKGSYLGIDDPLYRHPNWMTDDARPNDDGYAAIASAVTSALRPHIPG